MNYSGSKRPIEILSVKDAVRNGRIDGVAAELQYETAMLTNKHAHMADTALFMGAYGAERGLSVSAEAAVSCRAGRVRAGTSRGWRQKKRRSTKNAQTESGIFTQQEFGLWPSFDSIWEKYDGEKVDKELVFVYYEGR